jgi:ABC-type antimicrobial peptide transport system permease subunit
MVMLFAVIAVVLVAVGISGVAARTVSQRTRELGIRIALGSTAARASSSILIQAAPGIFAGVAGGIAVALPCAGLLDRYLFEVGATDLLTYAAAAGLLFGVSSLAVYLPARRIARLDAAEVLRAD